ncbi:MAG: cysteine synthase A [Nitrospirae bacterium]|nr:cysteine synthase A [Nitrospirota bacterium]MBF0618467.1 cysteine synthase A [Nitrospirota bacterium]
MAVVSEEIRGRLGSFSKPLNSVLEMVGETPLLEITRAVETSDMAGIFAKIEFFNPCSSVKDRICNAMIERAEHDGLLHKGDTIIEPTSGNTGIGLAFVCAVKGYNLILTMPETMSEERRRMLRAFGAKLILTEGTSMTTAVELAEKMARENGYFQPHQFKNPDNSRAHKETTAPEIIEELGEPDAFVAGVGTGGTITGVGEVLREKFGGRVRIVAVEPEGSAVLSGAPAGHHGIQGIGAGFIPDVLNRGIIDEIIQVSDETAYEYARLLIRKEGILAGISSGANLYAALMTARKLGKGKKVVTIFPDTGERYLSTPLFSGWENDADKTF